MPLAWLLVGAQLAFVFGAGWDIQWHYAIGRDRPFIPPHLLLLAGIAVTGLAALGGVLQSTLRTWRLALATPARSLDLDGPAHASEICFLGLFRAPTGLFLAGFGALCAALAFPWDDYWHRLYGLDVTIWAPFHVMIIAGMALAALGAAYLFSARRGPMSSLGTALALAAGAATLLLLQAQSLDREGIVATQPRPTILFPPLLVGVTLPWIVAASLAVRLPRNIPVGGTVVALVLAAIRFALFAFIPWALRWAAALDGARVRDQNMVIIATPLAFPAWVLVAGIVVDVAVWLIHTRRQKISAPLLLAAAGAIAALLLASLDRPWERTLPLVRGGAFLIGPEARRSALLSALPTVAAIGAVGALYGSAIGGALTSLRRHWTARRARATTAVLYALAVGLAGAALVSGFLALQGLIGPTHPPLLPGLPTRPVTSQAAGWIIGLVPAWGLLAFVVAETVGRGGPRLALARQEAQLNEDHRMDQAGLRLVRRSDRPAPVA